MVDTPLRQRLEAAHFDARAWAVHCCHGQPDEADDLLHFVYLAILEGKARYNGASTFRTWLFAVIRRSAAGQRRRQWLHGMLLQRHAREKDVVDRPGVEAEVERTDESRRLRALLLRLSPRQREVIVLVFYHDLSVEEAAVVMRTSVGSARTHYARGKDRLAAMLATHGVHDAHR
jgi:RNA polymerase sigma-70 factor (ECF subfamily)